MSSCKRAQALFGPCWDDEISLAEREWLEGHLAGCGVCRREYEEYSRALEVVGSLPRHEAAEGLLGEVLARARRASPAPDVIGPRRVFADERPAWLPVVAAAGVVLLAFAAIAPWIAPRGVPPTGPLAGAPPITREAVVQPRLVNTPAPSPTPTAPASASAPVASATAPTDSLFDHNEDVEFILDPVTLRRGRAHTVSRLPQGIQGEQAVITF